MGQISLETLIKAPPERCFDLSRSVDLHIQSAQQTSERAIAGVTSGLMQLGDEVVWEAIHFGIRQKLKVKVVQFHRPFSFTDIQLEGIFHSFSHEHVFEICEEGTLMKDLFKFKCPLGMLGHLVADKIVESYLKRFLIKRNQVIKQIAESDEWKSILGEE